MSSRVGVNLRASAYLHQGDRKYMEDEFQVAYQRTHDRNDIEYAFFGIFDGHGGKEAAHYAKDNLMDNIVSQRMFWSDDDEEVLSAIKEGFLQTHMAMWKELDQWPRTASGWPSTSGTTASIAFIRRQKIYIGHVGDSGIVLGLEENGEWIGELLTTDHKPESFIEMCRINDCGGKVVSKSGVPRVVWNRPKSGHQGPVRRSTPMDEIPFLAVARSLGDLWSYNAINDRFVVSPQPDVFVKEIDINLHRCLIFGTDGLWNALSPSTAVNIAYCTEKNNEKHYLRLPMGNGKPRLWINPSRSIVTGALSRYQRVNLRADNTSAVTVFLDPPGRPKREVLLSQFAMKKGSPTKSAVNKLPTKKVNREASVQVHVYNQTPREGNEGFFRIKERIPEDWQNKASTNSPSEDNRSSINDLSHAAPQPINKDDSEGTKGCDESIECSSSGCSECGCTNHNCSQSSLPQSSEHLHSKLCDLEECIKKEESISQKNCIKKEEAITQKNAAIKIKKDDIQIPVVSSSTPTVKANCAHQSINSNISLSPNSNLRVNRKTRSCISIPNKPTSENKKEKFHKNKCLNIEVQSLKTRASRLSITAVNNDSTNRILKNVNRGEKIIPTTPKFISHKRKRSKEPVEEERVPKSLRVHTRSRTYSHKPMITRSQDRTQKPKVK